MKFWVNKNVIAQNFSSFFGPKCPNIYVLLLGKFSKLRNLASRCNAYHEHCASQFCFFLDWINYYMSNFQLAQLDHKRSYHEMPCWNFVFVNFCVCQMCVCVFANEPVCVPVNCLSMYLCLLIFSLSSLNLPVSDRWV